MARGVVRAYDARTGTLRWSWDPIALSQPSAAANAKREDLSQRCRQCLVNNGR